MSEETPFGGFVPPTQNFFRMPNIWIDICADIDSLVELKVIQYVLRHTWGFQEYDSKKVITTDEFMHGRKYSNSSTRMDKGTGMSNRSIIDGLRAAVEHGYLEVEIDETDKGRKSKAYRLKMTGGAVKNLHSETPPAESDVKNLHSRCEDSSHRCEESSARCEESSHRSEKDTRERHLKKDTGERQREEMRPPSLPARPPQLDFPRTPLPRFRSNPLRPISPRGAHILDYYDSLQGCPTPPDAPILAAAEKLVQLKAAEEQIKQVKERMEKDPYWKSHGGVNIIRVADHFATEWIAIQTTVRPPEEGGEPTTIDKDRNEENKRKLLLAAAQRGG